MAKVTTSMTLDKETKEQAVALFDSLNLDMSTAVGLFLKQCVQNKGLPFKVKAEPTAFAVVTENADYNAEPITLGHYFRLEGYAARHIHYYNEHIAERDLSGMDIMHIMFAMMSISRDMFETPGELAADIADAIFDDFDCPIEEKNFFDSIVVSEPEKVSYKLVCGPSEQEIVTITGFPACTLSRIEQAVAIRRNDEDFKLSQNEIFEIIQYPMGWFYALAQHRAESVIKNGRKVSTEDMEYFVDGIMKEIYLVKRDYDLAGLYPDAFKLGVTYNIECNIPG